MRFPLAVVVAALALGMATGGAAVHLLERRQAAAGQDFIHSRFCQQYGCIYEAGGGNTSGMLRVYSFAPESHLGESRATLLFINNSLDYGTLGLPKERIEGPVGRSADGVATSLFVEALSGRPLSEEVLGRLFTSAQVPPDGATSEHRTRLSADAWVRFTSSDDGGYDLYLKRQR